MREGAYPPESATEPAASSHRMKILFVLGSSRCGSTILGNVLGEMPGFFSGGEIRFLWERRDRLCGCGSIVARCPVWGEVLTAAFTRGGGTAEQMTADARSQLRFHQMPRLLAQKQGVPSGRSDLARYLDVLHHTYEAIGQVTGARVLVDTSKRPSDGLASWLAMGTDVSFLHLVRDPRAVAFSQSRRKPNPDGSATGAMALTPRWRSSILWSGTNLAADALRLRVGDRVRTASMRYEDLTARPRESVARIMRLLDEPVDPELFVDERTVAVGTHHTVSGNPDRFKTGNVSLRPDDRWLTEMSRRDRWIVTGLTFPLVARYGYPIAPRRLAAERFGREP